MQSGQSRQNLMLMGVLILILVLGGVFVIFNKNSSKGVEQVTSTNSGGFTTPSEVSQSTAEKIKRQEIYNAWVTSWDETMCNKIAGDDALKTACLDGVFATKAARNKDVALCDKIQDVSLRTKCKNNFTYDEAIASGLAEICDKIEGDDTLKYSCKKQTVFSRIENSSFTGSVKEACAGLSWDDLEYCKNRIEKRDDIDYTEQAVNEKDPSLCNKIKTPDLKSTCSDSANLSLALEQKNVSLCGKIGNTEKKVSCTNTLSKVSDAETFKTAVDTNNSTLCGKITDGELAKKCTDSILFKNALTTENSDLCKKISDSALQTECTSNIEQIRQSRNK